MRNRGLFMLGVSTRGRISELLSLQSADVYQNGSAVTDMIFDKFIVKGREMVLGSSLKSIADQPLFLELALRGYDQLWDAEETGEIVKIG